MVIEFPTFYVFQTKPKLSLCSDEVEGDSVQKETEAALPPIDPEETKSSLSQVTTMEDVASYSEESLKEQLKLALLSDLTKLEQQLGTEIDMPFESELPSTDSVPEVSEQCDQGNSSDSCHPVGESILAEKEYSSEPEDGEIADEECHTNVLNDSDVDITSI
jgi:hypothetical protein